MSMSLRRRKLRQKLHVSHRMVYVFASVPQLTTFASSVERRWDRPVTSFHIQGTPLLMSFHSFDPHIAVANETDAVTYVSYQASAKQHLLITSQFS